MEANMNSNWLLLVNGCNWVEYIENNKIAVVIDSDVLEVWLQFIIVDYQVYVDLKVPIGIHEIWHRAEPLRVLSHAKWFA